MRFDHGKELIPRNSPGPSWIRSFSRRVCLFFCKYARPANVVCFVGGDQLSRDHWHFRPLWLPDQGLPGAALIQFEPCSAHSELSKAYCEQSLAEQRCCRDDGHDLCGGEVHASYAQVVASVTISTCYQSVVRPRRVTNFVVVRVIPSNPGIQSCSRAGVGSLRSDV